MPTNAEAVMDLALRLRRASARYGRSWMTGLLAGLRSDAVGMLSEPVGRDDEEGEDGGDEGPGSEQPMR